MSSSPCAHCHLLHCYFRQNPARDAEVHFEPTMPMPMTAYHSRPVVFTHVTPPRTAVAPLLHSNLPSLTEQAGRASSSALFLASVSWYSLNTVSCLSSKHWIAARMAWGSLATSDLILLPDSMICRRTGVRLGGICMLFSYGRTTQTMKVSAQMHAQGPPAGRQGPKHQGPSPQIEI